MFTYSLPSLFSFLCVMSIFGSQIGSASTLDKSLEVYRNAVAEERAIAEPEKTYEYVAGGTAAIVLSLYGYYNTSPNPLVKLLYAATQTAGVLSIGQSIRNQKSPRLLLEIDDILAKSSDGNIIEIAKIKESIATYKRKKSYAEAQTLAYTSTILSGLYFYNGYRESSSDKTLRNTYFFLGFNFAVGGSFGFYRVMSQDETESNVAITFAPFPTVTYLF